MKIKLNFRDWFTWEGVERLHAVVGIATACGALGVAIAVGWHVIRDDPKDAQSQSVVALSVTNMLLLAFLYLSFRSSRRLKKQSTDARIEVARLEGLAEASSILNREASKQRALIARHHYYFCFALARCDGSPHGREMLARDLLAYLDRMLDCTAKLFTTYTGKECAACVKQLTHRDDPGSSWYAMTLRRDPSSISERAYIDHTPEGAIYRCDLNAAFRSLLHDVSSRQRYIENDLVSLFEKGQYWNANPRWRSCYTATAVVPIKGPDHSSTDRGLGFLCVDNKGGGFDKDRCGYILEGISYDLYYSLRIALQMLGDSPLGES